ncbi:60S ribosomal protein L7 [Rhizoctonia solani]|uniref:60S ribosomal protein L7 n=1 Tax=Rhizoctonia solani TaxID=456999 RepID=A0A8H8P9U8_9AGAM|nr:60S ribosomal protein L7 [Rhizoctonia solani]QRW27453.1 60S ribosomal protein L7 [Rhizoctonia solani]
MGQLPGDLGYGSNQELLGSRCDVIRARLGVAGVRWMATWDLPEDIGDDRTKLTPAEQAWSSHQHYLESHGFILRPRLRQDWKPSWIETGGDPSKYEDSTHYGNMLIDILFTTQQLMLFKQELGIVDAIRVSDGAHIVLKAVRSAPPTTLTSLGQPDELGILKRLHTPPFTGHICNHAVPLLGSLPMPCTTEGSIAVLPLLRVYDDPPFVNVGEAVEFMKQVLRGLAFMHAQNVAHRDIRPSNIMMAGEVLYDQPFHPVAQSLSLDAQTILRPHARHELDSHRRHDGESALFAARNCGGWETQIQVPAVFKRSTGALSRGYADGWARPLQSRCVLPRKIRYRRLDHAALGVGPLHLGCALYDQARSSHRPTAAEAFAHFETIRGSLEAKCLGIPLNSKGIM